MKRIILAVVTAMALIMPTFAEVAFDGYVRAGVSTTLDSDKNFSVSTWYPGTYFSGDSTGSRVRINMKMSQTSENGNTSGAFVRFQYNDFNAFTWSNVISYADAYVGLFGNKVTVAGGKIYDRWIASDGFEGYSFLDASTGASVAFTPVEGLYIAGAAVKNYLENGEFDEKGIILGAKYSINNLSFVAQFVGTSQLFGSFAYKNDMFTISAEGFIPVSEDGYKSQGNLANGDIFFEFRGVEKWTFGVLGFGAIDTYNSNNDTVVISKIIEAVKFQANKTIAVSLEVSEIVTVASDSSITVPDPIALFTPGVQFNASSNAYANVWAQFSTDTDISKHKVGLSATYKF